MPPEYTEQLDEVFTSVLESMAFMFADLTEKEEMPEQTDEPLKVIIHFNGPTSGTLSLIAPEEMCVELAENLLGAQSPDEIDQIQRFDVLAELVNVTCGQLLTAILGEEPVYDLTPPEVKKVSQDEWVKMLRYENTVTFMVEDCPVLLRFSIAA